MKMKMKKEDYNRLIKNLSDKELLIQLYLTQLIILIVALILGFILFNRFDEFLHLFDWRDPMIWKVGALSGIVIVLLDFILMRLLPSSLYDDGGLNERIFSNRSIPHIAFISAIVAFSEEILFRGVIQTHVGLILSSVIFALIHYRYLFHWFLFLNIVLLSFFIGFVYMLTENLAVTIVMHFTIDFLLGVFLRFKRLGTGRDVE